MDAQVYKRLEEIDRSHWWFRGRRKIFSTLLNTIFNGGNNKDRTLLDIGCGSGANLEVLGKFGKAFGVDNSHSALDILRQRGIPNVFWGELPFIKINRSFDCVTAFDVVEHIDDDALAFKNMHSLLNRNGLLMGTVPAYQWLWSDYDTLTHHKRRYGKQDMIQKLTLSGFHIDRIGFLNTFIFPIAVPIKLVKKFSLTKKLLPESELDLNLGLFNEILARLFSSERFLLRFFNFPLGLSLFFIARKK